MATPSELSLEEIRNYLLENGGTARNHDLVKHFKRFLTDPETRGEVDSPGGRTIVPRDPSRVVREA